MGGKACLDALVEVHKEHQEHQQQLHKEHQEQQREQQQALLVVQLLLVQ